MLNSNHGTNENQESKTMPIQYDKKSMPVLIGVFFVFLMVNILLGLSTEAAIGLTLVPYFPYVIVSILYSIKYFYTEKRLIFFSPWSTVALLIIQEILLTSLSLA
jgi:hypothetical protein